MTATPEAGALIIWRWYDAVVLEQSAENVRLWEPGHGEVLARPRKPQSRYPVGTRAYASAGLPGADWWVEGPVGPVEDADVAMDEVCRFYDANDLWRSQGQARSWRTAVAEAERAQSVYDDVATWLVTSHPPADTPVATEVWVFTPDLAKVLLVRHRWRGWVPPGGKVDPGEHPRDAARREVLEETGLLVEPQPTPAAAAVRRFHPEWSETLALSYTAVMTEMPCQGEAGQPAEWMPLSSDWATYLPDDHARLRRHAQRLGDTAAG